MSMRSVKTSQKVLLKRYAWGLAAGWTVVVVALITFSVHHEQRQASDTALTQARSLVQRDVIYRDWNARYGPLYARTASVNPNPYLAETPARDVTTTGGETLTQVNPAYMSRLVFDLADREYGVFGHITSLRPVRPENRPDAWEAAALQAFARGADEVSSLEKMHGATYLRMMKPLVAEEECLPCHRKHGYRAGDIRGGISVAVPMEPLSSISRRQILVNTLSFSVLWLLGLCGIGIGALQLGRTVEQRDMAEKELQAAVRELDSFSATVSHDLRSPLATIGGFCQLIQRLPEDRHPEKCSAYTEIIARECGRMENLIHALLDFARLSRAAVRREAVDLSRLAAEVSAELRRSAPGRQATVTIDESAQADGDPALLRVVLSNLLGNAWKYTARSEKAEIEFGVMKRDGERIFFVRDNGAGFDPDQANRIFEAFHRLHSAAEFPGTGVGLATVKRIIARHGGRIWAEGSVGKGATFYFTLP